MFFKFTTVIQTRVNLLLRNTKCFGIGFVLVTTVWLPLQLYRNALSEYIMNPEFWKHYSRLFLVIKMKLDRRDQLLVSQNVIVPRNFVMFCSSYNDITSMFWGLKHRDFNTAPQQSNKIKQGVPFIFCQEFCFAYSKKPGTIITFPLNKVKRKCF